MDFSITSQANSVLSPITDVSQIGQVAATDDTQAAGGIASTGVGPAVTSSFSQGASLLDKLSQLKQSDPTKFASVMQDLAKKLGDAASESGDPRLQKLAEKFQQAAQTGDLSSLAPQQAGGAAGAGGGAGHAGHAGGHHHHHHAGAYGANGSSGGQAQAIQSFMSSALNEVDQALGGSTSTSTSSTSGAAARVTA